MIIRIIKHDQPSSVIPAIARSSPKQSHKNPPLVQIPGDLPLLRIFGPSLRASSFLFAARDRLDVEAGPKLDFVSVMFHSDDGRWSILPNQKQRETEQWAQSYDGLSLWMSSDMEVVERTSDFRFRTPQAVDGRVIGCLKQSGTSGVPGQVA